MELGADRTLFMCWLPTSPVTWHGVAEDVFRTVTVRSRCRETGLKEGDLRSVVMVILVSLVETVVMTSCMKWETARRPLPLCGGSAWLPKHAFPISPGFWFLIYSRTEFSSSWIQPATVYFHFLESHKKECLFFKEAYYQLYWFVFSLLSLKPVVSDDFLLGMARQHWESGMNRDPSATV